MQIIKESSGLDFALAQWAMEGESLALVPTMGALHDGHLALIAEAKRRAERVAATIFVNPLQFDQAADLQRYPRTEEADLAKLESAGCDLVWLPSADGLYPHGFATTISVAGISRRWEGQHRPGHFDGVATVVAKLLIAASPQVAIFGEKDWQQLAVVRRMAADLGLRTEIVWVPTVREADGLALSSRNVHLSRDERIRAAKLPQVLAETVEQIKGGLPLDEILQNGREKLSAAGFSRIDYLALVDAETLEPLQQADGEMRLIAAAVIGTTRLIDNVPV
jgi:pantoate--beta-alanine ligase